HLIVEAVDTQDGKSAARVGRFVFTRSALLTVQALNCFDIVEAMATEIFLPPTLLTELRQEEAEHQEVARRGRTSIGFENGQPILFQATPADGAAGLANHEALIAWVVRV